MDCKSYYSIYYAASESECWLGVCLADDASAYSNFNNYCFGNFPTDRGGLLVLNFQF